MNQVKHKAFDFSVRGELRYQESMRRHTSWHAGGYAQRAYVPFDLPDLSRFLRGYSSSEPVTMIGMGSNLLVRDGGLRGTAVLLHRALNETRLSTTANIENLIDQVQSVVKHQQGTEMEREIQVIGEGA